MNYNYENVLKNVIMNSFGLKKYMEIMATYKEVDINSDEEKENFQKKFNGLYKIRRNDDWRNAYYDFFQKHKNDGDKLTFKEIIEYLYGIDNQVEASFSSKMLATINPDMPIWDQYVLKVFDMEIKGKDQSERLEDAIKKYQELVDRYKELLKDKEIQETINKIRKIIPNCDVTDTKLLDFIHWTNRE